MASLLLMSVLFSLLVLSVLYFLPDTFNRIMPDSYYENYFETIFLQDERRMHPLDIVAKWTIVLALSASWTVTFVSAIACLMTGFGFRYA